MSVYVMQGAYALVEFASRESVASLLDEAVIPTYSHEATVPFKSRLLSLKNLGPADPPNLPPNQQFQPQTSMAINQLINRLAKEETVSEPLLRFAMSCGSNLTPLVLLSGGTAAHLAHRSISADRGEQPTTFPSLLAAQRPRCNIFPTVHHQTVWLLGKWIWKAGLRPGHDSGPRWHHGHETKGRRVRVVGGICTSF